VAIKKKDVTTNAMLYQLADTPLSIASQGRKYNPPFVIKISLLKSNRYQPTRCLLKGFGVIDNYNILNFKAGQVHRGMAFIRELVADAPFCEEFMQDLFALLVERQM
jgi:hypothetical protein